MPRRRSRLRLGTGLSLTHPDPVGRAGPGGLVGLGPADLGPAARDPVDLGDRAVQDLGPDRAALVVRHPVDPVGIRHRVDPRLVVRHPVDPVGIRHRVDRAAPVGLAVRHLVDPAGIRHRAGPASLADMDLADPVGLADLDLAGRVGLADRVDPAGRVDLGDQGMDPVDRVDRHHRRTHPRAISNGVVPRWVAPGMCRTASAHPTTVHRLHRGNMDGVGMADRHPERRRLSGTDRRPRVAGAVHRLPAVGMSDGMGRTATKALRSVISDRSITTGTTRSRCSIRCSVDGASGSSVSGSRCTETT